MGQEPSAKRRWHERPMRIAALQGNFEGGEAGTLAVADLWSEFGFNVDQLFHAGAEGYGYFNDPDAHGDVLRAYLDKAHEQDRRIILYLNVHIIMPYRVQHNEQWGQRDAEGQLRMNYGTYVRACLLSGWRDDILSCIDKLGQYDIDGLFLDGPILLPSGCFCANCRREFQERYGKPLTPDAPELFDFVAAVKAEFVGECYRRFKTVHPDGVCYLNIPIGHPATSGYDMDSIFPYNDLLGSEGGFVFYGPPKDHDVWRSGRTAKMLEAYAEGKPTVIFMAGDQKPWSWYTHTDGETRLITYSAVANGANVWYGLHGATSMLDSPGGRAAREVTQRLARLEPVLTDTHSAAKVAVLYSWATERNYSSASVETDFTEAQARQRGMGNFTAAFEGVCAMLYRGHAPFDVVFEKNILASGLERYDCLLLPTCACLSDAVVAAIVEYVRGGGRVVATFQSGCFDENGQPRPKPALDELFGVESLGGVVRFSNFDYSVRDDHELTMNLPKMFPAPLLLRKVRAATAEAIVGTLQPLPGPYDKLSDPGEDSVFVNTFGRGEVLYLAGTHAEMYADYAVPEFATIACRAVRRFAPPEIELHNAPPSVEITLRRRRHTRQTIVHLVNYTGGMSRPVVNLVPIDRLMLSGTQPITEAVVMPEGEKLTLTETPTGWEVQLPVLTDHLAVVLTPH